MFIIELLFANRKENSAEKDKKISKLLKKSYYCAKIIKNKTEAK